MSSDGKNSDQEDPLAAEQPKLLVDYWERLEAILSFFDMIVLSLVGVARREWPDGLLGWWCASYPRAPE